MTFFSTFDLAKTLGYQATYLIYDTFNIIMYRHCIIPYSPGIIALTGIAGKLHPQLKGLIPVLFLKLIMAACFEGIQYPDCNIW